MHALMEKNSSDFPGLNSLRHHWTLESVVDEVWAKQIPAIDSDATRAIVESVVNEFRNYLSTSKNLPRLKSSKCPPFGQLLICGRSLFGIIVGQLL